MHIAYFQFHLYKINEFDGIQEQGTYVPVGENNGVASYVLFINLFIYECKLAFTN